MNNKTIKNKAGVSAVMGVILMVAITVAIACTVYVYVSDMINDDTIVIDKHKFEGILYEFDRHYIVLDDITISAFAGMNTDTITYLSGMLGQNITIILTEYDDGHIELERAYINK